MRRRVFVDILRPKSSGPNGGRISAPRGRKGAAFPADFAFAFGG